MSIFTTIIGDLKSFASKIEAEFKKLFGKAPTWLQIASGVLTYIGPIVVDVVQTYGGSALGTEASKLLATLEADVATAKAVVSTSSAATNLPALLSGIQAQLPAILAAIKVENPALVAKVEASFQLISSELTALLAAIPQVAPAA